MVTRRTSRRGRAPSRRGPRRQTTWENLCIEFAHGTAGSEVIADLTPEPMGSDLIGTATLIRSLMEFSFMMDTASTGATVQQIAFGITVMTNDAFAAGAVPDPLTGDFQQSWYYWTCKQIIGSAGAGPRLVSWNVDIRSARRLRGGFKLVAISESPAANDLDTTLFLSMRNLWQITS